MNKKQEIENHIEKCVLELGRKSTPLSSKEIIKGIEILTHQEFKTRKSQDQIWKVIRKVVARVDIRNKREIKRKKYFAEKLQISERFIDRCVNKGLELNLGEANKLWLELMRKRLCQRFKIADYKIPIDPDVSIYT